MNRAVITTAITIGVLMLPVQAVAAERTVVKYSAGHQHKHQQDWRSYREHRREAIPHRNSYNQLIIKTDYRAVKKRVAAYRLKHPRHHRNSYANPRQLYIHYYGPGNGHHYDRHRQHCRDHQRGRHSHSHHHDRDYLQWLSLMAMLDNIYSNQH